MKAKNFPLRGRTLTLTARGAPRRATPARAAARRELSAQKVTQEFFDFGVAFHAVA